MSSDLTFGPSDQEWHYSQSSKTYDLSGGSPKKLTIPATEGPEETLFTISPKATALVIVDMQNFFLDAKCMDHPNGLKACRFIGYNSNIRYNSNAYIFMIISVSLSLKD